MKNRTHAKVLLYCRYDKLFLWASEIAVLRGLVNPIDGEYTVTIKAEGMEKADTVTFMYESPNKSVEIDCEGGKEYIVVVTGENIKNFSNSTYKIIYNESELKFTEISGSDIKVINNENGVLEFEKTTDITDMQLSGIFAVIKFEAKQDCTSTFTLHQD